VIELRRVTTSEEFRAMRGAWEELFDRAPSANIFLSFDWLATWWRHYSEGWRLNILAAYEGHRLVGLAPLMGEARRVAGIPVFRRLAFLGAGISDRLDMLVAPGSEPGVLASVIAHLRELPWDIVDLDEIPEDSVTAQLVPELARGAGITVEMMPQSVCPVVKLAIDAQYQRRALSKSIRDNLAYYRRRLEREHSLSVEVIRDGVALSDGLAAFFRVYRKCFGDRPTAQALVGERFAAFRRDVAAQLAPSKRVQLTLLRVDGQEVAGELSFMHRETCYCYNLCYDPAWKQHSVRMLVQWEAMRAAMAAGCHEYDCLRGDEDYKYRWGAQPRRHVRIRMTRSTPRLRALRTAARLARRVGMPASREPN
jgi:CelD/BcsL family acetyltransferase involved in cellulose biosynthesis